MTRMTLKFSNPILFFLVFNGSSDEVTMLFDFAYWLDQNEVVVRVKLLNDNLKKKKKKKKSSYISSLCYPTEIHH